MQEANAIVESEIIVTCCMFEPGGLDETNGQESRSIGSLRIGKSANWMDNQYQGKDVERRKHGNAAIIEETRAAKVIFHQS